MVYKRSKQSDQTLRFKQLAENLIKNLDDDIKSYKNRVGVEITLLQLEKIRCEVEKMISISSSKDYTPSFPRMIVDSWDFNNKLGIKLLEFNEIYIKVK